jgi:hypothetical protein
MSEMDTAAGAIESHWQEQNTQCICWIAAACMGMADCPMMRTPCTVKRRLATCS